MKSGGFDLPPEARRLMACHGFIERLPTTIFWSAGGYVAGFALSTLALAWLRAHPAGLWLAVYYVGAILFVPALYLFFAGGLSRSAMRRGRGSSH